MIRQPNALQKLFHRFFMQPSVTAFFATRVHSIDKFLLRISGGRLTGSQILGWNIIQLTTIGARSRQPRTMPLVGLFDGEKIALVASSFGREHNPGWYYNLKAHPECEVQFKDRSGRYRAHEAVGEQYDRFWQMAVSVYAGYDRYKRRAAPRHIPIMVLEPRK